MNTNFKRLVELEVLFETLTIQELVALDNFSELANELRVLRNELAK